MVMCNTPMLTIASCAPPTLQFPNGFCPVNNGISCNQRYPPSPILTSLMGSVPPTLPLPPSPTMVQCAQISSTSTSPNTTPSPPPQGNIPVSSNLVQTNNTTVFAYTPIPTNYQIMSPPQGNIPVSNNVVPTNNTTVFTYTPVPTNYQIVPYNQMNQPIQCKAPSNQTTTTMCPNVVPCNPDVYTCNAVLPTLVPCQQRLVNETSVLQYTPRMCPLSTAAVYANGTVEMCPLPSSPVIPNNPAAYPVASMSIAQNIYTTTATSWKQSYGMEQVWQLEFRKLFSQYYPHIWSLLPVCKKPNGIWNENVDSAKVRFCCEKCGHGWTSMKGRVAFWFVLNPATTEGVVCLKLYGQQCDRCKLKDVYEPAMWYPEEVTKVLVNIYNRVGQAFYGFLQAPYHKTRRAGKPRTPHNSELCQACKDGVCAERR